MKRTFKGIYKGIRSVLVTVLVAVIALFIALYVALLLPSVQQRVKAEGEKALSELLHTQVTIGKVDIKPFNQLVLHDVDVPDQQGDSLLHVETLAAGIDLSTLLRDRRLLFTYGEIIGLKGHVVRPDKDSPTNLQFIIDAFKPKPNQPPKPFDVEVRGVVIRDSELTYDVLDQPHRGVGVFDVNHLILTNLRADVALPRLRNDDFDIRIKRLAFDEQSGLALKNMTVAAVITDSLSGVELNSAESNFHMISFSWQDNWVVMDVFHALTDGTGAYEVVRTFLYYLLFDIQYSFYIINF